MYIFHIEITFQIKHPKVSLRQCEIQVKTLPHRKIPNIEKEPTEIVQIEISFFKQSKQPSESPQTSLQSQRHKETHPPTQPTTLRIGTQGKPGETELGSAILVFFVFLVFSMFLLLLVKNQKNLEKTKKPKKKKPKKKQNCKTHVGTSW